MNPVAELRAALEWYAEEVAALQRNLSAERTDAVMASVRVLTLDAGNRALKALGVTKTPIYSPFKPGTLVVDQAGKEIGVVNELGILEATQHPETHP